jgi:CelD/BcsL family acetyltransferase involved in cellulose biosynthesis
MLSGSSEFRPVLKYDIEIIDDVQIFRSSKEEWNRLSSTCEDIGLARNFDFIVSWWEAFRRGRKLRIVVLKDDSGRWVAVSPMYIETILYRGIPIRVLSFMENGYMPACGFLMSENLVESTVDHFCRVLFSFEKWEMVRLPKLPTLHPLIARIRRNAGDAGFRNGILPNIETPVIDICGTWDEFLKTRSSSFRKQLRSKRNRFSREPGTSIDEVVVESENVERLVQAMTDISAESWKSSTGADLASNPSARYFLERMLTRMSSEKGNATVWFALKDGKPIAYELHLRQDDITYPLRADFNESFKDLSPGSVLEAAILEKMFASKELRKYYSCGTTYGYLMRWTDQTVSHSTLEVFSPSLSAQLGYRIEYGLIPILRKLSTGLSNLRQ